MFDAIKKNLRAKEIVCALVDRYEDDNEEDYLEFLDFNIKCGTFGTFCRNDGVLVGFDCGDSSCGCARCSFISVPCCPFLVDGTLRVRYSWDATVSTVF